MVLKVIGDSEFAATCTHLYCQNPETKVYIFDCSDHQADTTNTRLMAHDYEIRVSHPMFYRVVIALHQLYNNYLACENAGIKFIEQHNQIEQFQEFACGMISFDNLSQIEYFSMITTLLTINRLTLELLMCINLNHFEMKQIPNRECLSMC